MSNFYTLLTAIGAAEHINAQAGGVLVPYTHLALGDGNGAATVPTESMSTLKREVHRVPVSSITVDTNNPNWLVIEAVVPTTVGGWTVREIGLVGGTGAGNKLLAVGNFPDTYKPLLEEGSGRDLVVRMIVQVSNASVVKLTVDPSVALATNQSIANAVAAHEAKADPHPNYFNQVRGDARYLRGVPNASTTERGIVELATATETKASTSAVLVVTPAGLAATLGDHTAEAGDPHTQYFNAERLAQLLVSRDQAGRARRHYYGNF